ncbi:MAG: hypothetical protein K0S61_4117 [Anaerocolumna sp.]|jgi:hypothetical protein|nr:hypothetical protein [Anaerocolumna sp.]
MSKSLFNKRYFEGWYFKHQIGNQVIAFIPGINLGADGKKKGFIQIISNENSYYIDFPYERCKFNRKKCYVKIGANVFSKKGIKVNLHTPDIQITGKIKYGSLERIKYCIMGYYRYLPFMECKHEVISMKHSLKGYLNIFDNRLKLTEGRGYIEKDWGHSFPSQYTWLQCNRFKGEDASFMLSIAKIPYLGFEFLGCICVIHYKGKEYRFTTYLGVKIKCATKTEIYLKQGKYKLIIFLDQEKSNEENDVKSSEKRKFGYQLNAPAFGEMNRPIKEDHLCECRFILLMEHSKVFDLKSKDVSVEFVE